MPALDQLAHLHPLRDADGAFAQTLPALPAGHYKLFADVVLSTGFPITGIADVELPDLSSCGAPAGDDSTWAGEHGANLVHVAPDVTARWTHGTLHANSPEKLEVHVLDHGRDAQLEPYMGMAAHAEIVRTDGAVFAHIHPNGSVAMPALELTRSGESMQMPGMTMPAEPLSARLRFPYGFPQPGDYRVFVQFKLAGVVRTAAFDAHVE